jgi:hypothetical protein
LSQASRRLRIFAGFGIKKWYMFLRLHNQLPKLIAAHFACLKSYTKFTLEFCLLGQLYSSHLKGPHQHCFMAQRSIQDPSLSTSVRPQTPPVRPQTPSVRPQTPSVRPQTPSVRPQTPSVQPQTPPVRPQTPSVRPQTPPEQHLLLSPSAWTCIIQGEKYI